MCSNVYQNMHGCKYAITHVSIAIISTAVRINVISMIVIIIDVIVIIIMTDVTTTTHHPIVVVIIIIVVTTTTIAVVIIIIIIAVESIAMLWSLLQYSSKSFK